MNLSATIAARAIRSANRADNVAFNSAIVSALGSSKPKKPKRKKLESVSKLKKRLWAVLSEYIKVNGKREQNGLCRACGARPIEVAAHIVPSLECAELRFDERNIYAACAPCNFAEYYHRAMWVGKHRKIFGAEFVDGLYAIAHKEAEARNAGRKLEVFQFKRYWLMANIEEFTAKLAALSAAGQRGA